MSDIFGSIIGDAAAGFAMISQSGRSIGGIIPDVVIDEINRDTAVATGHPVETGTPVSDHYFFMPQIYELRCGWSDSTVGPGYINQIYQRLQSLMQSRKPFDITSGKRQYQNMMFLSLVVRTDVESENALMLSGVMQQIIMVDVTTSSAGATPANTDGSSGVGNVNDGTTASGIAAQNASNAGWATDSQGNVSFQNGVAPGGTVQLQGVSQTASWDSFSGGGVAASANPTWEGTSASLAGAYSP